MTHKIKVLFIVSSIIIVTLVLSISVRAYANDKRGREYREAIASKENGYEREIRECLDEYGFKNAGINLTKEYDEERNVTYNLSVNHHSFEYASIDKMNEIEDRMYEKAEEYLEGSLETSFTF